MVKGANNGRKVVIIGGGIAGLAAALCFARTGAEVRVFEQAQELKEVGAGLQITPNGGAVLAALGLADQADHRSIRAETLEPVDAHSGRSIARFDLTTLEGQPYRFFHRADLLDILATAASAAGVTITTDARAEEIDGTMVRFSNGEVVSGDLVVGADGLHSVVRKQLNKNDKPFFTGQVAWRSVVNVKDAPATARIWMAAGKHVVTYPLIGGRMNIVAVQERSDWAEEGWHYFDEPSATVDAFSDCDPSLLSLLGQMQTVRLWGLFRHPVARNWHDDNRAIIGDAAHPTLPFLAQGANLALEDAFVLAKCLDADGSIPHGLRAFQSLRRARAERAIATANGNARNYHLSGLQRRIAHAGLSTIGKVAPSRFLHRYDWLYGHDVTT